MALVCFLPGQSVISGDREVNPYLLYTESPPMPHKAQYFLVGHILTGFYTTAMRMTLISSFPSLPHALMFPFRSQHVPFTILEGLVHFPTHQPLRCLFHPLSFWDWTTTWFWQVWHIQPLQMIQIAAVWLTFNLLKFPHTILLLSSLNWLPVVAKIWNKTKPWCFLTKPKWIHLPSQSPPHCTTHPPIVYQCLIGPIIS